jgi:hypothetical protein
MKKIKILITTLIMVLLTACNVFLGPDPNINDPKEVIKDLWAGIDETYAYFDRKKALNPSFDWDKVKDRYLEKANSVTNRSELYDLCKEMLDVELKAYHSLLYALPLPYGKYSKVGGTGYWEPNEYYVKNMNSEYTNFHFGRFNVPNDNIGYIGIASFYVDGDDKSWVERINEIIKQLKDTDAIILDVCGNPGGDVKNTEYIANRFTQKEEPYCKEYTKNGPGRNDFSAPEIHTIKPPARETERYTKRIALLTHGGSFSSAEWFTLALRTQPHVTHIGERTCGGFTSGMTRRLINGWYYSVPNRRLEDITGNCWEDFGIAPKILIKNNKIDWPDLVDLFDLDESENQLSDNYNDHRLGRALIWLKQNL